MAYHQIPRTRRADKHIDAASWIETTAEDRLADQAEILVHHYEQAFELKRAAGEEGSELGDRLAELLVLAGDRAFSLDATSAVSLYRRALDLQQQDVVARAATLSKLAEALYEAGEGLAAEEAYAEAIPVLREAGDDLRAGVALWLYSRVLWARGGTSTGLEASLSAVEMLERVPGTELVAAYGSVAMLSALAGRTDDARRWAETGLRRARELGVGPEHTTRLLMARSTVRGYEGDPEGVEDQRAALEIGLRFGLGIATATAYNNLSNWDHFVDGPELGLTTIEEGMEFSLQRGLLQGHAWMRGERLVYLYELGQWERLLPEAEDLLSWAGERGRSQLELGALIPLMLVHTHRGQIDAAVAQAGSMLSRARGVGDPQNLLPALDAAALAFAAAGDGERAVALVTELERESRDLPSVWRAPRAQTIRLCATLDLLDLADAMLKVDPPPYAIHLNSSLSGRAILAEARGASVEARELYAEAAAAWREFGNVVETAYALLGLGRSGDADAAREGEAIFERLGARPVATAVAA